MKSKMFVLSSSEIAAVGGAGGPSVKDAYLGYYTGAPHLEAVGGSGYSPAQDMMNPGQQKMVHDAYAAYLPNR